MKIHEKGHFGAKYTFTKVHNDDLLGAMENFYQKEFDAEKLKSGEYAKEAIKVLGVCRIGRQKEYYNLVPNVLKYELATLISGTSVTPTFKVNKICLGDDATVVDYTDTALGNETLRTDFSDRYSQFNVAYLDKFYGSSEVGGNSYYEAGVFVDGTATVDSGYLFSHLNINETMSANESLTINVSFTITDS